MSQIAAGHDHSHGHGDHHGHEPGYIAARKQLDMGALTWSGGAISGLLMLIGVAGIAVTVFGAFSTAGDAPKAAQAHALAAYLMGFLFVMGLCLGSLGFQMILQQFNAGWSAAPRRQAETIASLSWVLLLLFVPIAYLELFQTKGLLFAWMDSAKTAGDPIFYAKKMWLNPTRWMIAAAIYFTVWISLGTVLYKLSRKQDETGDRWITAKARFISSFGLLLFALTTAFASFDWLMSLDYHWFSTMFGVYFFAGSIVSTVAMLCVVMCTLRIRGKFGATFT